MHPFAVVLFDVNDLKHINDTLCHEAGDAYIISACKNIYAIFKKSPVYRIGGDEFVIILEGEDYINRMILLSDFNKQNEDSKQEKKVIISFGLSEFNPESGETYSDVFQKADDAMYACKRLLKANGTAA